VKFRENLFLFYVYFSRGKDKIFFVFYILSFFREKELPCCFLVRKFDQIVASLQLEGKKMYL